MNDINWIDSYQAHMPGNTLRTSNSFARSDTGVVIDSESHEQNRTLVCSIGCLCLSWLFRFSILQSDVAVNTLIF